jgi:hypothetical protein
MTGLLHYRRHFVLLACTVGVLVLLAAGGWSGALGVIASFGLYGALHSAAVAMTVRAAQPPWRKLAFVAGGASLSMSTVALALVASRFIGSLLGAAKPAVLLALSSGGGAAAYAMLARLCFAADITPPAMGRLAAGCAVAALAVLASGLYLHGGLPWFAAIWWLAFSIGLWDQDRRRTLRRNRPREC